MNAEMEFEKKAYLDAYWAAETPDEFRLAYAQMMAVGFAPSYGEEKPRIRVKAGSRK